MRYLLAVMLVLTACPSYAAVDADPFVVCYYSKITDRIHGFYVGGFPTKVRNEVVLADDFTIIGEQYIKGECNLVYDADVTLPSGSPTKTLCAPPAWATVPGTPTCGGWVP